MKPLKNFILSQRMRFFSSFPRVERKSIGFAWAKSIGMLAYVEKPSQVKTIRRFVEQLEREGKKISCLVFTTQRETLKELEKTPILTYQDINLLGEWKSQEVSRFLAQPFDYLFCLSTHFPPPITYILQHCKAKCRVGMYQDAYEKFFELMLGTQDATLEVLSEEMLHYTKAITCTRQVLVEA